VRGTKKARGEFVDMAIEKTGNLEKRNILTGN
jgi:hypothetical protein